MLFWLDGASSGGAGWYDPGYGSAATYYGHEPGYGNAGHHGGRVVTRVTYEEQPPVERQVHVTHEVHHVLNKKKRRKQLVAVVPAEPVAVVAAAGPDVVGLHHRPHSFEA